MNETEIVFKVDKPGDARAVLRQVDGLVDTIGVSAVAAGVKLDKNLVDSLAKMSPRALEQINAELLKIAPNASAAAAALNRVNGAGGGAVGRGPADAVMTDDRVMRRKFDNAARGLNGAEKLGGQMREVAVQADKSAMNVQKLGVALSALPAEIPVLGALSAGGGIGLLVGAAGAIAFKLKSITDSVRESYELVGKLEAKRNVNMYGLTGGADQRTKELQGLRDLQRETAKLAKAGAYDEIRKLHESVVDSFMSDDQLASRIGQAVGGLQRLGGDTRSTGEIENIKKLTEARKKATEDFNEFSRNHFEEEERGYQRLKELEKAAAAAKLEAAKKDLEQFKTTINEKMRISSLFNEAEKLRGGMGGEDARTKAATLDQQKAELFAQIQEARMGGDEAQRRKLLSQFERLGETSIGERLDREAKDREIALLQQSAAGADTPGKQAAALDALLQATQNIGSLTSDQIDIRSKALAERIGLGDANQDLATEQLTQTKELNELVRVLLGKLGEQALVKVEVVNDSQGAAKVDLGEAPNLDNSRTISDWTSSTRATGL